MYPNCSSWSHLRLKTDGDQRNGDKDGPEREDITAVYAEMESVLVRTVIPKNARGDQFRCGSLTI